MISKLEGVIETKMKEEARRGPAAWAKRQIEDKQKSDQLQEELNKLTEEYYEKESDLNEKLEALTSQKDELEGRVVEIEAERDEERGKPKEDPEQVQKIKMQQLTINALKDQIRTNARESQKEISELKIKLFEHEHNNMNDDSDSDDDTLMTGTGGMSRDPSVATLASSLNSNAGRLESLVDPL